MIKYNKNSNNGFTLIELMIVVAIIGLLATLGVGVYSSYDCKAKQAEAKKILSIICNAQIAYYVEHTRYATELSDIGFSLKTSKSWYTYEAGGNDQTFVAKALNGPKGDAWSIDDQKNLGVMTDGCGK